MTRDRQRAASTIRRGCASAQPISRDQGCGAPPAEGQSRPAKDSRAPLVEIGAHRPGAVVVSLAQCPGPTAGSTP